MKVISRSSSVALATLLAGALLAVDTTSANGRRFYVDDPLTREPETQDASGVAEWDIELIVDIAINLFGRPGDKQYGQRAGNINTIDEVPDSSWFTNRIGSRPVTIEEAVKGPVVDTGPAPGRWTVIAQKRAGAAPGFTIRDSAGQVWFVSFDAVGFPEAATGAIMVANKIFWTLGYWQVENHLITVRPDQLDIDPSAKFTPLSGRRRAMVRDDLDEAFERSHRSEDGSYRAAAARGVPGRTVGGFKYYGTRPDDPNDIVPHEHRRELRALKVFGAWTNLVDMKAGNTLDSVITTNGRGSVRHYLQDVGSTFGTGAQGPREFDEGWEYLVQLKKATKRLFLFGLPLEPWHTADYADNEGIGRFEGTAFDPPAWKPRVPTAAFLHARLDDSFWAARRVAAFSDEMIRAMVKAGGYSEPSDEALLADVLIQRRDKITSYYFNALNPLVEFSLSNEGRLSFRNAAVDAGVGKPPEQGYRATWSTFDNTTGSTTPIGSPTSGPGTEIPSSGALPSAPGAFVKIGIVAVGPVAKPWTEPVDVYFRRVATGWQLVGVDRMPSPQ
jgi:hypothetical protein